MPISENIKILRERYSITQKELAEIAGVSDKAVSTWENGTYEPRMGAIQKIADHFGLQKSNIIEENGMNPLNINMLPVAPEDDELFKKMMSLDVESLKIINDYVDLLLLKQKNQNNKKDSQVE